MGRIAPRRLQPSRRRPWRERVEDWLADLFGLGDGGGAETLTFDEDGFAWCDVESSNVEAIGWNPETNTLRIRFGVDKPATTYEYPDFPRAVMLAFRDAPSKGSFVWAEIRNGGADDKYPYRKL